MTFLLACALAGAPLLLFEILMRRYNLSPEIARKAVHVGSALAVILLTTFCPLRMIAVIGLAFCVILLIIRNRQAARVLYSVKRQSWGEIAFPAGIALAALLASNSISFVAACAIVGLADTLAALSGQRFGRHKVYMFSSYKSLEGSIAFWLAAALLLIVIPLGIPLGMSIGIALVLTVVEFISPLGLDNLTVPVACVLLVTI